MENTTNYVRFLEEKGFRRDENTENEAYVRMQRRNATVYVNDEETYVSVEFCNLKNPRESVEYSVHVEDSDEIVTYIKKFFAKQNVKL